MDHFPKLVWNKMKIKHYVSKNLVARRLYKGMKIDSGGFWEPARTVWTSH